MGHRARGILAIGQVASGVMLSPIARRVQEALARAKLQGIAVGLRGGALYLGGIPLAQVPALGKALAAVKIA